MLALFQDFTIEVPFELKANTQQPHNNLGYKHIWDHRREQVAYPVLLNNPRDHEDPVEDDYLHYILFTFRLQENEAFVEVNQLFK